MKKKIRKIPLSILTTLIVTFILLFADIGLSISFAVTTVRRTENIIKSKIMETGYTAAALLDGNVVGELTQYDKDNSTERYAKAYNTLAAFKTNREDSNGEIAYIYLLVKEGGRILFSIDPSDDPAIFLQEEPIYTFAMWEAFAGKAGCDDKPYTDRWGELYSGYVPVRNNKGEVTAVVGVDVWAEYLHNEVSTAMWMNAATATITIALGVAVSLLITYLMRKKLKALSEEFVSLEDDIEELVKDIPNEDGSKRKVIIKDEEETGNHIEDIKRKLSNAKAEIRRYIVYANEMASTDRLTKLLNRNAYFKTVKTINETINEHKTENIVVAIYDVNALKQVNDTYGHEYGDKVLKIAGRIIRLAFGQEATYRIGGDEFVIVMPGTLEDFKVKDAKCQEYVRLFNDHNVEHPFSLSLSSGAAQFNKDEDKELLDVFRKADKKMYQSKKDYYKTHNRRDENK